MRQTITLQVKVKPRAKTTEIVQSADGTWVAKLKSPPVDGKANDELIALIAQKFHCAKSQVTIKAGAASRTKIVRVETR